MTEEWADDLSVNALPVLPIDYARPGRASMLDGACAMLGCFGLFGIVGGSLLSIHTIVYMVKLPSAYGGPIGQLAQFGEHLASIFGNLVIAMGAYPLLRHLPANVRFIKTGCVFVAIMSTLRTLIILQRELEAHRALAPKLAWENWTLFLSSGYELLFAASYIVTAMLLTRLAKITNV